MEYQVNREPRRTVHVIQPGGQGVTAPYLRQRLIANVDDFAHIARLRLRQARLNLLRLQGDVDAGVRRQPRQAMLAALAAGLVLGFLLRRRQILNREEVFLG